MDNSHIDLLSSKLSSNNGTLGGALHGRNANVTVTSSTFEANLADGSGGAIYIDNSNAMLEETTTQLNHARDNCGGICAVKVSHLEVGHLTIQSNSAGNVAGGIGVVGGSSILCYSCMILNNRAFSGGGLHIYSDSSMLVVAQLQNSTFENNSAQSYGGALTFNAPLDRSIEGCHSSSVTCGNIILLNTHFVGNNASLSRSAIPTSISTGVLVDCEYKGGKNQDFLDDQDIQSLHQWSPKQPCPNRIENILPKDDHGEIIGTLSQVVTLSMTPHDDDGVELSWNADDGYVLENVLGGKQVPRMYITVMYGFEETPTHILPNSFEAHLSSFGFFSGLYSARSFIGSGLFSNVTLFAPPGHNTLEIRSHNFAFQPIRVKVMVRNCSLNEEPTADRLACQECNLVSYNFNISNVGGCAECPSDATCRKQYIVPDNGYWHRSPCHDTIQKCPVEEACAYKNRNGTLTNFTSNFTTCDFNEMELEAYNDELCKEGYEGPLCGSCKKSFGLSARFLCIKCISTALSWLVIIAMTIYLLVAAALTIGGSLPLDSQQQSGPSTSNGSPNDAGPSNGDQVEQTERARILNEAPSHQEQSSEINVVNGSPIKKTSYREEQAKEHEHTRWKATEVLKIMINFLQTIAIAASVSVPWGDEMEYMFESSDYIGVFTINAISQPIECLFSSGTNASKALSRMLVSVSIPIVVTIILASFWGFILSATSVAYISYLGLTKMAIRAFYCVDVYDSMDHLEHSTHKVWAIDSSIGCFEKEHYGILIVALIVLLVVTICYPLISAIVVLTHKKCLENDRSEMFESAGFLFRAFRKECAYWEIIVMFRKACLSVIVVFSYPLGNQAELGGVLFMVESSNGSVSESNFTNNQARTNGGAFYIQRNSNVGISGSAFTGNEARSGGSLYLLDFANGTISQCLFTSNKALNDGGAIYTDTNSILSLTRSTFLGNEAIHGGASFSLITIMSLQSVMTTNNSAEFGGALYAYKTNINITNSTFEKSSASRSGGSIYIEQSNAKLENTILQSNAAIEDCGGVCVYRTSYLNAHNLTIQSNSAGNMGGGIAVDNGSSILCYACMILNNRADRGAGLHVYSDISKPIVAQLQNSRFENNSAYLYGGGIEFNAPLNRTINCGSSRVVCGSVVLLHTTFVLNFANFSGGAIITTHASRILIDCHHKRRERSFIDNKFRSSLRPICPERLCPSWLGNQILGNASGAIVGTYGQEVALSIDPPSGVELVESEEIGYVLKNVSSGKELPNINIKILDEFGDGPAHTLLRSFGARLSSISDFIRGEYPITVSDGLGYFTNVTLFARPGAYTLKIQFDSQTFETLNVSVIVRECQIGEEPTEDRLTCQSCDEFSYNFNTSEMERCEECPSDATCRGKYIIPKDGHWHKSPCHDTIQECFVEDACSLDMRYEALMNFTKNLNTCDLNKTELEAYNNELCNKGYEGLLCGSCKSSYGLSATFQCLKCSTTTLSILIIIGITIYLLLTAAFTIRGCLPRSLETQNSPTTSNQSASVVNRSRREVQVNIEMAMMLVEGHAPLESFVVQQRPNNSQTSTIEQENEYEITRWRINEIFKILINFLQTIAIASNVSVRWTDGMLDLFESSEYVGGLTTAAMTRPVDCIVSSSSPISRAIWRMLLSLFVPLLVMIIFFSFWCAIAVKNRKGWGYFWKRCTLSVIAITYISYLGLTRMAVRAFYCVNIYDSIDYSISSKRKFWAIDTAIKCYGKDHFAIIAIAVIVLTLITVSYPLFSAIILSRKKNSLRRRNSWTFETTGFLFRAFKQKFAYWESIVMFRKACLSVIVVFSYPLGGDSQGLLASILLFFCLYVHLTLKPYRKEFKILNHFESMALLISGLTFNLGVFFVNGRCRDSVRIFLAVVIILGNSSFFLFLLLALFYYTMVHLRVVLQYENVPLPDPPTWWNILKVYISLRMTQWRQSLK
eukprot:g3776.t1